MAEQEPDRVDQKVGMYRREDILAAVARHEADEAANAPTVAKLRVEPRGIRMEQAEAQVAAAYRHGLSHDGQTKALPVEGQPQFDTAAAQQDRTLREQAASRRAYLEAGSPVVRKIMAPWRRMVLFVNPKKQPPLK